MKWIFIENTTHLTTLDKNSFEAPQLIFKHSTRCNISELVLKKWEKSAMLQSIQCYYLDLIKHRDLSNLIAEKYGVEHQSPQILLIKNGSCILEESHMTIDPAAVQLHLAEL